MLRHRANVKRVLGDEADAYGSPTRVNNMIYDNANPLRCYVQDRSDRTVSTDGVFMPSTYTTLWAGLAADIIEEDVIMDVRDKAGRAMRSGSFRVVGIVRREGHKEAMLEAYG